MCPSDRSKGAGNARSAEGCTEERCIGKGHTDPDENESGEQRLVLDGVAYGRDDLAALAQALPPAVGPSVVAFLTEWFAPCPVMRLRTSGSTGAPKEFFAAKERMRQSARLTCEALGLKAGDKTLLCMPLDFIAGKMMMVRALMTGLDLRVIPPCGNPLDRVDGHFDFSAMVPLQVYNSLKSPEGKKRLGRIKTLLIGGGAIDPAVEKRLAALPGAVYATYGMTETLSHIALRRVSGLPGADSTSDISGDVSGNVSGDISGLSEEGDEVSLAARYVPFASVSLSLSDAGTLVIDAPLVCEERLVTRDLARIHPDGSFELLGRLDNVINTGGIKVQIEEVEARLSPLLSMPFAVTATPHEKYGEAVTLLVQGACESWLLETIRETLPPAMRPKTVFEVEAIPLTSSGKVARAECRELARVLGRKNADAS